MPQFIVEGAEQRGERVKILVTQPRRIAAITLARRVAEQVGEQPGKSVGYRIGQGDHLDSKDSKITFVTVGYLLQYLSHNSQLVQRYTHIVLDEVHERSMDADMLNLLIKKLMSTGAWPAAKLVVMSATLQANLFSEYFTPTGQKARESIFVGVRRFPVRSIFLDELCSAIPVLRSACGKYVSKAVGNFEGAARVGAIIKAGDSSSVLIKAEVSMETQNIIVQATVALAEAGSCILIFLPGIGEISAIQDDLELASSACPLQVCAAVCLPACFSAGLSVCLSVHLSFCMFCRYICLSLCNVSFVGLYSLLARQTTFRVDAHRVLTSHFPRTCPPLHPEPSPQTHPPGARSALPGTPRRTGPCDSPSGPRPLQNHLINQHR